MENIEFVAKDFENLRPEDTTKEQVEKAMAVLNSLTAEQKSAVFHYGFAQYRWGQEEYLCD